jgi:hypothetical protein
VTQTVVWRVPISGRSDQQPSASIKEGREGRGATKGTSRHAMLERIGRSLDQYVSLTNAMVEACGQTIMSLS